MALKDFINGFVGCALWLGHHYVNEEAAERGDYSNLDELFYESDIPEDVMTEITKDCADFYETHAHLWAEEENYNDDMAGHDFFLSRNGHGAGFWDRDIEHGDELHDATKPYGSFGLEAIGESPISSHN